MKEEIVIPILALAAVAAMLVAAATVAISAFDDHQAYSKKCQTDKKCLVKQKDSVAWTTKGSASGFDTSVDQEAQ